MQKPFFGVGVGFPITVDQNNMILHAEYEESIRQSILIILGTAKGERMMRPDFGCGIYDMVFENATAGMASRIAQEVRESLLFFEPRIDVLSVEVTDENRDDGQVLHISIDYEVRATNNVFNLVYPFYLEKGSIP